MESPEPISHGLPLRHVAVIWLVLLVAIVGAFAAIVMMLNSTVYSAGGFVGSYLSALQRHDVKEALTTPGVVGVAESATQLLDARALGTLEDIQLVSDENLGTGLHLVIFEYSINGTPGSSSYQVQYSGDRLGFFSTWSFVQSPIGILQVTPLHAAAFEVNGIPVVSADGPSEPQSLQVLTPGSFELTHESTYLEAQPVTVLITKGSGLTSARLDIEANDEFVSTVQTLVNEYLDECTTQTVLFPTGCPFGQELSNRVEGIPEWSMASYPEITIVPGSTAGAWLIPETPGAAHLTVEVRSLFDGTLSTFDEDVQFALSWVMTFSGDSISINAQ